jgi:hypothetical protein
MKTRVLALPALLLLLFSCGDGSVFLGQIDDPAQVEILTVESGSIVSAGGSVPIELRRDPVFTGDEETADSLLIELLDESGILLAEQQYDSVDEATTLPAVDLPLLEDGLYQLRTTYFDGEEIVAAETVPFYITGEPYRILGLTSYPASSYPEADGLLSVSLDVPLSADPFLVWRINSEVVEAGLLSDTTNTIAVLAPEGEGAFPVRVDLYPFMPDGYDYASIPAPSSYSAELFVTRSPAPARYDLTPESSYFALYHFRGTLRDDGVRVGWFPAIDFAARPFGEPGLDTEPGVFGYRLDGASGFESERSAWPVKDGRYSPVSFSIRLNGQRPERRQVLFSVSSAGGELISASAEPDGTVEVQLRGAPLRSGGPLFEYGEPETITVSIIPGEELAEVSFHAGGFLVSAGSVPFDADAGGEVLTAGPDGWAITDGTTVVGAPSGGFAGIVDEFGVFFRDEAAEPAVNAGLLLDSVQAEFPEDLIYAHLFTGEEALESVEIDGEVEPAVVGVDLEPGASVTLPALSFSDETLVLGVEANAPEGFLLVLREAASGEELARLSSSGQSSQTAATWTLVHSGETLVVTGPGLDDENTPLSLAVSSEFGGIVAEIRADAPIRLLSVYARIDAPAIPDRVLEISSPDNG